MGLFDGILGGVIGGEMSQVVNTLIQQHGGVQGIVTQLEQQGLGATARSWVNSGTNLPITPDQVQSAFGNGTLQQIADKFGFDPQTLAKKLSQVLPQAVDHLTPNGSIPQS